MPIATVIMMSMFHNTEQSRQRGVKALLRTKQGLLKEYVLLSETLTKVSMVITQDVGFEDRQTRALQ